MKDPKRFHETADALLAAYNEGRTDYSNELKDKLLGKVGQVNGE